MDIVGSISTLLLHKALYVSAYVYTVRRIAICKAEIMLFFCFVVIRNSGPDKIIEILVLQQPLRTSLRKLC